MEHGTLSGYASRLADLMLRCTVTGRHDREIALDAGAREAVQLLLDVRSRGKKVIVLGNGGSAAMAGHVQNDLSKGGGMRAMVFDTVSLMTAIANDDGYECVYERPLRQWAEEDDVLIAISSSGASRNILQAVESGLQRECKVITFSGFKKTNPLACLGDLNFHVPVEEYGAVESLHAVMLHYLTDSVQAVAAKETDKGDARLHLLKTCAAPLT